MLGMKASPPPCLPAQTSLCLRKARDVALQQGAVAFNAQLKTFLTEANKVIIFALTHQLLEQPSVLGQAVPLSCFSSQCFFEPSKLLNVMKKNCLHSIGLIDGERKP
jgi:hypothetical protein